MIECISTSGRLLSPWIIFKGKQHQKAWHDSLQQGGNSDGFTAVSDNGWTDNELGLEWLEKLFELQTRSLSRTSKYRLLIFDGHASHISTKAIQFCIASNIILLCLLAYSTYLLQLLDVSIFLLLATAYQKGVQDITCFRFAYSIDKVDFLDVYQKARTLAITLANIQKAWNRTGFNPLNRDVVLEQLPKAAILSSSSNPQPQTLTLTHTAQNKEASQAILKAAFDDFRRLGNHLFELEAKPSLVKLWQCDRF